MHVAHLPPHESVVKKKGGGGNLAVTNGLPHS